MGISRFARNDNWGGAILKHVISNPCRGEKSLRRLNINSRIYGRGNWIISIDEAIKSNIIGISRFARNDNWGGAILKYVISNPWKG